jgi:hypothetical protein
MADRLLQSGLRAAWLAAVLGSVLMALGFAALWHPPNASQASLLGWLAASLLLCTLAYSAVSILHQAWGTRWGGEPDWRARVTAWREGSTLAGVLLASVLPTWLGFDATSMVLMMALVLGLLGLHSLRRSSAIPASTVQLHTKPAMPSPWADASFRRLLSVFMLNGVAAAIPATLLPFFVMDRLHAPDLQPLLLLCYFGAAAAGLPLWVKAVSRWGLAPSWRAGMLASVIAFSITPGSGRRQLDLHHHLSDKRIGPRGRSGAAWGFTDRRHPRVWPRRLCRGTLSRLVGLCCQAQSGIGSWTVPAASCRNGIPQRHDRPCRLAGTGMGIWRPSCLFKLMAWACLWRGERLHQSWRLK